MLILRGPADIDFCDDELKEILVQLYKPTKQKGTKRKRAIVNAFTACVRKQGYANTSLVDIAKEADVFPSLLFYYFKSKEDLLRVCFQRQCDIIVSGLEQIEGYDLEGKINYITDFLFNQSEQVNTFTTGFMYEAIGISVNDEQLGLSKRGMDRCCKNLLAQIFVGIDEDEAVRQEKAEIIYALLAGTKLNGYFEPEAEPDQGRESFRKVIRLFCHLDSRWLMADVH